MTPRRLLMFSLSVASGAALIIALIRIAKIDWHVTLQQLGRVGPVSFLLLVLLNALLLLISTLKWLSIDAVLRRPSESAPSLASAFAFTSIGMALGLILPVQLGMSIARTLGVHLYGSALKRGTAGTLIEQSFDLLVVGLLAFASAVTWYSQGGAGLWWVFALTIMVIALLSAVPLAAFLRRLTASPRFRNASSTNRMGALLRTCLELGSSGLLSAGLARRLFLLSAVRYFLLVLMSVQTARAINIHIPFLYFAAALPFVVIAMVLAVTPGGIGVNELASASMLKFFGTPLSLAADWALANRVLVMASCFVVAACAAATLAVRKFGVPMQIKGSPKASPEET
jgi:uncharacterized membrane protein YbhN (UPF0104 family)